MECFVSVALLSSNRSTFDATFHDSHDRSHQHSTDAAAIQHMSFFELVIVLAQGKKKILTASAIGGGIALTLAIVLPVRYTASATFLPPTDMQSSGSSILAQLGSSGALGALGQGSLGFKTPLDLQVALLRSDSVEDAVTKRFDLARQYHTSRLSDTRKALAVRVGIDATPKDGLIHLSVVDSSAQRAAELANGYIDEYSKFSSKLAISEAAQRRLFFERQLQDARDQLANAEEALKKTEQTSGLVQADAQARSLIQSTAAIQAQIAAKEVQVQSMRAYAGSNNVDLIQAQQELAGLRAQLSKLHGSSGAGSNGDLTKGQFPQIGLDYIRKERDVKYQETLFQILARQFEAAKLDESKEGTPVQVIDPALPPDRRSFPPHTLLVLAGLLFGGFLGGLFVAIQSGLTSDPSHEANILRLKQAFFANRNQCP